MPDNLDPGAFRRAVKAGYDSLSDRYAAQRDEGDDVPDLLSALFEDLPEGARVLDAGCGAGDLVLDSRRAGATGIGLDASLKQVRRADGHGIRVFQGDMTRLPFHADGFDAVTAMYSLIHMPAAEHAAF